MFHHSLQPNVEHFPSKYSDAQLSSAKQSLLSYKSSHDANGLQLVPETLFKIYGQVRRESEKYKVSNKFV